jgi:hypothetical protein
VDGRVQALGDPRGLGLHDRGDRGDIISSVVSVQSASQRPNISDGMRAACLQMDRHRIALVAAAGQHHRRPEVGQGAQVMVPVPDRVVEHRTQLGVGADAAVEALQQGRQGGFDLGGLGRVHGGA